MKKSLEKWCQKKALSGAQKICGQGGCMCGYPCSKPENKEQRFKPIGLFGSNTTCPLEKYPVTHDTRRWTERTFAESNPTQEELFALCALCFNTGDIIYEGYEMFSRSIDRRICCDCPVQMVSDSIQETEAEARMS